MDMSELYNERLYGDILVHQFSPNCMMRDYTMKFFTQTEH